MNYKAPSHPSSGLSAIGLGLTFSGSPNFSQVLMMNLVPNLRSLIRKSLPSALVDSVKNQVGSPNMLTSLQLLKAKGFAPSMIVDIGAYQGWWSKTARMVFPDAAMVMVEPLPDHSDQLSLLAKKIDAHYFQSLCGREDDQKVIFYLGAIGSSIYVPKRFAPGKSVDLNTITLDSLLSREALLKPDLIKIDVQGAEEDVLKGAKESLDAATVVILELSIVNSYSKGLLVTEMIKFMEARGFLLYDIAGLNRANRTRSVNEFDGVFVRKDSDLWNLNFFLPDNAPDPYDDL